MLVDMSLHDVVQVREHFSSLQIFTENERNLISKVIKRLQISFT